VWRLADKGYLALLAAVPLLWLWERFLHRRGRYHVAFSSRQLAPPPGASAWKFSLRRRLHFFKLAAFILLVLALCRPQWLTAYRVVESPGCDILLALDISGSMAAVDFKPRNRLEVAKEMIARFIANRRSDRLALVAFAATAYTKCPLTVDYGILTHFLNEAAIGDIEDGTALGVALATSVNRVKNSPAKTKIVILLTDGMNNRGEIDPRDAARMARDFGVKVYAIGVGTRGEAPYPVVDTFGRERYITMTVEIDEPLLREIASSTGGLYFRATDSDSLQGIFREIDRWEKSTVLSRTFSEVRELFPYFLATALLLLAFAEVARRTFLRLLP